MCCRIRTICLTVCQKVQYDIPGEAHFELFFLFITGDVGVVSPASLLLELRKWLLVGLRLNRNKIFTGNIIRWREGGGGYVGGVLVM